MFFYINSTCTYVKIEIFYTLNQVGAKSIKLSFIDVDKQ